LRIPFKDNNIFVNNLIIGENDRVKEDALAHLSDQLLILSERIQQLEKNRYYNL
jgi:hypothetical protein